MELLAKGTISKGLASSRKRSREYLKADERHFEHIVTPKVFIIKVFYALYYNY